MSIEIQKLLKQCRIKMQGMEQNSEFSNVIRRPNRPVILVYLGEHREDCKSEVEQNLDTNWPQHSNSIMTLSYETPEQFRAAMNEDANGVIALEDAIIEQCNPQKGFGTRNNIIFVYFLNLNSQAGEFIELLNEPFSPPAAGVMSRYIMCMSKFSHNAERKQAMEAMRKLNEYAHGSKNAQAWNNTYLIAISDFMRGGAILPEEEAPEGYAIAADLLLICNSVDSTSLLLPLASAADRNFITGSFKRKGKPRDEIIRAVLFQYLNRCVKMAAHRSNNQEEQGDDLAKMLNCCVSMMGEQYMEHVKPCLPEEYDLAGLPNGAMTADDVGEFGGADKTFGVWKAFRKMYFEDVVDRVLPNFKEMVDHYERGLGNNFSCAQIQQKFGQLKLQLKDSPEIRSCIHVPQSKRLHEYGQQAANRTMVERSIPALMQAVDNLQEGARTYQSNLDQVQKQLYLPESDLTNFYYREMNQYLDRFSNSDELICEMKRPCTEAVLEERILRVFESLLSESSVMYLSFGKELEKRTDANKAAMQIASVLNVTESQMEDGIRMHLGGGFHKIGDFALVNPQADYFKSISSSNNTFEVSRTDCLDRVAFYAFDMNHIM